MSAILEDLTRVVAAWRKKRAPQLADAAIAIGAQLDATKPPLSKAKQKAWLELANAKHAEDLGRLLATLFDSTPPLVTARLDAIAAWPDDPRTSATLAAYVAAPKPDRIGPAWRAVFQKAIAQLVALADPASALPLVAFLELRDDVVEKRRAWSDLTKEQVASCYSLSRLGRTTQQQLRVAAAQLAKLARPKLTAAEHKALPSATAPSAKAPRGKGSAGEALVAEIYTNPADDAVRLAYADWLQDQGDPRGEFIVLQCQRAAGAKPSARERTLLSTYERTWIGEIAPALLKRGVRFGRGFVAAGSYTNAGAEPFIGHPSWATVEELELSRDSSNSSAVSLIQHDVMRSLRTVRGMRSGVFQELLASARPLALETVAIDYADPAKLSLATHAMPHLGRLEIGFIRPELVATLLGSKLGAQLTALVAGIGHAGAGEVEGLVTAVKKVRGLALTSLELVPAKGAARSFAIRGKTWTPTRARR